MNRIKHALLTSARQPVVACGGNVMKYSLKAYFLTLLTVTVLSVNVVQGQTSETQSNSDSYAQASNAGVQFFKYPTQARHYRSVGIRLLPGHYKISDKISAGGPLFSTTPMSTWAPQIVTSLNGLMGNLTLVPGANITITPAGNNLTIATAGLLSLVSHNATLAGDGTGGSPLSIANGGVGTNHLADLAVTAAKLNTPIAPAAGQVLSFNGGSMTWQTPASSIASVAHDSSLTGDGTSGSPLGISVPLTLESSGSTPVLTLVNSQANGFSGTGAGLSAQGASNSGGKFAASGVLGRGGDGNPARRAPSPRRRCRSCLPPPGGPPRRRCAA